MARALYDAGKGYYSQGIADVGGGRADFATSATLSGALGRAIAGEIVAWAAAEQLKDLRVVEVGGGDGSLMAQVKRALPMKWRWRIKWGMVEVSKPLRRIQQEKLGKKVRWFDSMSEAVDWAGEACFIYSNELLDAFPVRVFKRFGGEVQELYVEKGEETWGRVVEDFPKSSVMEVWEQWREGVRVEVCESYREWLAEWAVSLSRARMVTVDYGDEFPLLFRGKAQGTVRGYRKHQMITGVAIYEQVGEQDLTADVNFTDVREWGEELGLKTMSYKTQREFLSGFLDGSAADEFLSRGDGAGEAFKVLIQEK